MFTIMAIKAIVFSRVSTKGQSLEDQKNAVMKEALRTYKTEEIIEVEGKESAVKIEEEKRETINEMKEYIEEYPTVESIFFFGVDRLARRVRVVVDVVDDLTKKGINCVFLNPTLINTIDIKNGKKEINSIAHLILIFLGYAAEMEAKMFRARVANSKSILRQQGKIASGKPIFGYYAKEDNSIGIKEDEASIVRRIFNRYGEDNCSINILYKELSTDEEVTKITDYFSKGLKTTLNGRIRNIIVNKSYSGRQNLRNKRKYSPTYPQIVDIELQDKCIAILNKNQSTSKKETKYIYYAKGLVRNYSNEAHRCLVHKVATCCYHTNKEDDVQYTINLNVIEEICRVNMIYAKERLTKIDTYKQIEDYKKLIDSNKSRILQIEKEIDEIKSKMKILQKKWLKIAIYANGDDSVFTSELKRLKDDITEKNNQKSKFETENQSYEMLLEKMNDIHKGTKGINIDLLKGFADIKDDALIAEYCKETIEVIQVYNISRNEKKIIVKFTPIIRKEPMEYVYISKGSKIEVNQIILNDKGEIVKIPFKYKCRFERNGK